MCIQVGKSAQSDQRTRVQAINTGVYKRTHVIYQTCQILQDDAVVTFYTASSTCVHVHENTLPLCISKHCTAGFLFQNILHCFV